MTCLSRGGGGGCNDNCVFWPLILPCLSVHCKNFGPIQTQDLNMAPKQVPVGSGNPHATTHFAHDSAEESGLTHSLPYKVPCNDQSQQARLPPLTTKVRMKHELEGQVSIFVLGAPSRYLARVLCFFSFMPPIKLPSMMLKFDKQHKSRRKDRHGYVMRKRGLIEWALCCRFLRSLW